MKYIKCQTFVIMCELETRSVSVFPWCFTCIHARNDPLQSQYSGRCDLWFHHGDLAIHHSPYNVAIVLQEMNEKVVNRRHMNAQRLKCGIQRVQVPQEILGWPHTNAIEAYAEITNVLLSNKWNAIQTECEQLREMRSHFTAYIVNELRLEIKSVDVLCVRRKS